MLDFSITNLHMNYVLKIFYKTLINYNYNKKQLHKKKLILNRKTAMNIRNHDF